MKILTGIHHLKTVMSLALASQKPCYGFQMMDACQNVHSVQIILRFIFQFYLFENRDDLGLTGNHIFLGTQNHFALGYFNSSICLKNLKILSGIYLLKTVTTLLRSQGKRHYLRVRKQEDSYKGKKEVVILQLRCHQGYLY